MQPSASTAPSPSVPSTGQPYWLIQDYTVAALMRAGMRRDLIVSLFDNPRTLLIVKGSSVDDMLPNAQKVVSFTSYGAIETAIAGGALPRGTKYVLYDNEKWAQTPLVEQENPIVYAEEARTLLHRHGLGLIFAPGVDLVSVLAGAAVGNKYSSYISLDLAAKGASASDIFEIQAQQAVGTPEFATFVTSAVAQAKAADPGVPVLIGLSTNPLGRPLTASDLLAAYDVTRTSVAGYWLNIPSASAKCPSCGVAQPQVAASFLEDLG